MVFYNAFTITKHRLCLLCPPTEGKLLLSDDRRDTVRCVCVLKSLELRCDDVRVVDT